MNKIFQYFTLNSSDTFRSYFGTVQISYFDAGQILKQLLIDAEA